MLLQTYSQNSQKNMITSIDTRAAMSKVPAVTLTFWIIKILATTLGETGGDTVTMTLAGRDHRPCRTRTAI